MTCHVVVSAAFSEAIKGMVDDDSGVHAVPTLGGCTLMTEYKGNTITLTDEPGQLATVTVADVALSNGVIHVIDTVMLSKQ